MLLWILALTSLAPLTLTTLTLTLTLAALAGGFLGVGGGCLGTDVEPAVGPAVESGCLLLQNHRRDRIKNGVCLLYTSDAADDDNLV